MKNEKNPPVEKGASLSENESSVGNKMESEILRSLMRSSKWHYCFNASCSKAQECAAFLSGKILIHEVWHMAEVVYILFDGFSQNLCSALIHLPG